MPPPSSSDGKIFVEAERARLTRQLAALLEEEGKMAEASDIIQVRQWWGVG